ncbi:hypothetical protein [Fusobacterium canifelinum]|uniref:hypothetical protein n=1 Tax=Fusobacterium canifelinum TaxID=285729 RepID=UPI0030D3E1DB
MNKTWIIATINIKNPYSHQAPKLYPLLLAINPRINPNIAAKNNIPSNSSI